MAPETTLEMKRKSTHSLPSSKKKKTDSVGVVVKKCAVLIDLGIITECEPVRYLRRKDKFLMKEGEIVREGILCSCCSSLFTLSKFELHAGSALHRPSANMFLRDGRSLAECEEQAGKGPNEISKPSGNHVRAKDGRTLAECEEQAGKALNKISKPSGLPTHSNSMGSCISGLDFNNCEQEDSNTQFKNKCFKLNNSKELEARINHNNHSIFKSEGDIEPLPQPEDANNSICEICGDDGQVILCDSCASAFHGDCLNLDGIPEGVWHCPRCQCGFCRSGEDGASDCMLLSCVQCRIPYHRECLFMDSHVNIKDPWFCSRACQSVFIKLRRLAGHVFPLDNGLSCMLLSSAAETSDEKKLYLAREILKECFDPIIDGESGVDVLSQVVFNRKSRTRRLDCSGFHTMLLSKGEQLVSAATIRIHGDIVAEVPFVGTSREFRKLGMCEALMRVLETLLRDIIGVHMLVTSSADGLVDSTWTNSFNFKPMSIEDCRQLSHVSLLSLPRRKLQYKTLL